jgi:hypothetical protein
VKNNLFGDFPPCADSISQSFVPFFPAFSGETAD